jgi:hypothetical protein
MTALPVAHYLRDLNGEMPRGAASGRRLAGGDSESDIEQRLEEAYIRGVLEGRAAAQAEYGEKIQRQTEAAEKHLKSERERWVADEASRLGTLIGDSLECIGTRVAEQVARILKPFLGEKAKQRAMEELVAALDALLLKGEYSKIRVSGPEDLISALRTHLGGRADAIAFLASERSCDVFVTADETILETRLGSWLKAIDEAPQ